MNTEPLLLKGVVTALGTPLDDKGDLHEEGMRKQVEMQLGCGVHGFLVLGSMGAMQLQKDETFQQALAVVVDAAEGKVPVIVGCGDSSSDRTLRRIRWAEQHPVNGVALVPPFVFQYTDAELQTYFTELAASTNLPVYLYDNPAVTKHSLDPELIFELSKIPNIVGLKESGSLSTLRSCAERFADSSHFRVLSGKTTFLDVSLYFGVDGLIDGLFALAPELGLKIWESFQEGDFSGMRATQRKYNRLAEALLSEAPFASFTEAMNLRGIPGSFVVRPHCGSASEGAARLCALLEEFGLVS